MEMNASPPTPIRVQVFQHVPFEGLGHLEPWLRNAGCTLSTTRFFESDSLPEMDAVDFLLVLGGPMSVKEEAVYPWLAAEKGFIRQFIQMDKPVLGICLGAQLMANALGARIYRNPETEIGWFPVEGVPQSDASTFSFPPSTRVFHWHGETFDLPPGARHLARSAACENQAFQVGSSVLGLQFHLETTPESLRALISNACEELVSAPFVQSETELLATPPATYEEIHNLMEGMMTYLLPKESGCPP